MTHIQGKSLYREGDRVKLTQLGQRHQQDQGVLSAGYTDGYPVAGLYHMIVLYTPASQG